ncbi:NAD(P)/FAD-dependent oxidoreductase [Clostridium tyrobutyricum]|jgi:glycerol-3-phosphate dehydrogenase|uniref:NAD(P)/FAD-dependent oxidoreductase n=2 Tax=Clostridium tyrobutyricum TaxID=1519 RepID=UPI0003088B8B|nr:NAD(P)/FAD-dependent oxidoreductase [Clostridium tyrobutyricum]MBR9648233.1 NAD(P)/FAD-dependent oxidoreductase [Clostridium tyrobutyricum]MBV4414651.1 NAD(P)/FAD-dependent oxidoreductase [Clostridium tyrobutyricum]MBV4422602.1 NAD(P)/FAD-dependent oxidoreductase [Clostridium tyrobutyricum]MBV4426074.1 NAD(P)/FAD-dependent oxidoreductase [Clostridium tyrobutyricum]MBV4428532.1 NAD(P)/FAD-dependent oxidoreductase [Clostridium tyrobutyricum]
MFDVTIIGSGVIGSIVARELSRYKLNICVIEADSDVANGTSKANSAIVHAGFDAKPDTLKGKLNAKGNKMFDRLSEELDFPFKRIGSLVLCFDENDMDNLRKLKEQGEKNGVPNLEILSGDKVRELEPNLSKKVVAALYAPTGAIVCPYEMTIALAENAADNGVEFKLDTKVLDVKKDNDTYTIKTDKGFVESKLVINAAGVFADEINNMVSSNKMHIIPRKGQYCLFDKAVGNTVSRTIFQLPTKMGKGVLVTPTVDGNLLIGPNAEDIGDKEDLATTSTGMDFIIEKAGLSINQVPMRQLITSFSGLRAHSVEGDFIIGEAEDAKGFINAAGIESPGLSSAPSIAELIKDIVVERLNPNKNDKFNPIRKGIPKFREMTNEDRKKLIAEDDRYGKIICRCETVTEGEIVNSINRTLGARSLDGVKKRTRAGMGRCQSGFCAPKVVEILARELHISPEDVTKFGKHSNILVGKDKANI